MKSGYLAAALLASLIAVGGGQQVDAPGAICQDLRRLIFEPCQDGQPGARCFRDPCDGGDACAATDAVNATCLSSLCQSMVTYRGQEIGGACVAVYHDANCNIIRCGSGADNASTTPLPPASRADGRPPVMVMLNATAPPGLNGPVLAPDLPEGGFQTPLAPPPGGAQQRPPPSTGATDSSAASAPEVAPPPADGPAPAPQSAARVVWGGGALFGMCAAAAVAAAVA